MAMRHTLHDDNDDDDGTVRARQYPRTAAARLTVNQLARQRQNPPDAHGPGPPHRPHMPGEAAAADFDFALPAPSAPTANTLNARAVFVEPHEGHFTFASPASALRIVRCNCSNFSLHALHVYS
jgi:hypothetical protein